MAEYRLTQEKDGIKVEMVVTVDSTVKVGFLITNNRGTCYVTIEYYDSLGNRKSVTVQTAKGDLNKSTGAVIEFQKPNPGTSFNACFDIVSIADCTDLPRPTIVRVTQQSLAGRDWLGEPIYDEIILWENGNQKAVPVFIAKDGFMKLIGYSRSYSYWYPISKVDLFVTCFFGQWSTVDLITEIGNLCVDCYTDVVVYPEGGYYTVTDRKYRDYYEDFYFSTYTSSVSVSNKGTLPDVYLYNNECKEVTVTQDCRVIVVSMDGLHSDARVEVYHNNVKIYERSGWCNPFTIAFFRSFRSGDILRFCYYRPQFGYWRALNIRMYDYSFNEVFDTLRIRAEKGSYKSAAEIRSVCVAEELADEYVNWLRSKGYNVVKINPAGTFLL